jgi:hypothetical protein
MMELRSLIAIGILSLFVAQVHARPANRVVADVPFERAFGGIPFVDVTVNDSEPLQFLIDTGGASTIIDHDVATRLELETAPARGSVSGNESLELRVVLNAKVSLGRASVQTRLSVHRLAALAPTFGRRIDGILGGDFFENYAVAFDFDSDRVRVFDHHVWNGKGIALPLVMANGVPFVKLEVRVAGGKTVAGDFLIDSAGGWMTIHVHRQVAERAKIVGPPGGVAETGLGLGGTTRRTVLRGASLTLGPHVFAGPPVAITDDTAGLRTHPTSIGLVGVEVLRKFNAVFDYRGRRLYLRPSRAFSQPFRYDSSGLRLQALPPAFTPARISAVVPASPAAEAGFRAGGTIIDIDGRSAAKMTLEQLRQMLREPGKRHAIRVERDRTIVPLVIKTRELL